MKIAIPVENDILFEHFGKAKQFKIYTMNDLDPLTGETVAPKELGHEAVAQFLKAQGVDVILCGNVGEEARSAVQDAHMLIFSGASGSADEVVNAFLEGNLDYQTEANCSESGCGGGCASCGGGCHGCTGHGVPYVETRSFGTILHLTKENFEEEVLNDPGLIIIDFWAEWCQPCKMFAPIFAELNEEEPQVKFCKVNVDEQPELANMFGIDSIPTVAVVQDRHTLSGMMGVHSKEEVKKMLEGCKK